MSKIDQTIEIPHLGGSKIGYTFGRPYDPSLPTLVLVNSFSTSAELYRPQFADPVLGSAANLLALEPYGHGRTRAAYPHFTYWDSAIANLQVLAALGIGEAFVLGTSQGGWMAARMALLAPDVVKGLLLLGTSMDFESPRSRDLGCWDAFAANSAVIDALAEPVGDDWVVPDFFVDAVLASGLGGVPDDEREFWLAAHRANYAGDDGRHRLRVSTVNLRDRDGLHGRLDEVRCPVRWLHGTADQVYSVANAEEEIRLFTGSPDARLEVVEGGQHFLSASHPAETGAAAAGFVKHWA
ncbi:alpha/beta fold hydrolase [Amycolatopsis saalfeldensis]|uniref:Pimeloyl-ACP methyl ester carboxylesterase n=1 Tax=Amycolatopsis saalfeldensis TaxID=394193 RepID=A0A1H8YQN4_9PSEU|nr:alpha/beta hydrolase [Amycolatopsis saalfeldensis]SEP54352.1 Pimeloyl-ACP methyl ester carboxylesterase [Amycolatopsis saalfeldensis]